MLLLCHPIDDTVRVLSRPEPTAIHRDWTGGSYPGTGWTLVATMDDGKYLAGELRSPRGQIVNPVVFVIRREWKCTKKSTNG